MSCPECGFGNIAEEKTRHGWSGDYVYSDCGYNNSKDASGVHGKNEFSRNNKERRSNEKS